MQPLLTVGQQRRMILEQQIETLIRRGIELTIVVTVLAAYFWPGRIDRTPASWQKMPTNSLHQQIPAGLLLVHLDSGMGDLPQ